MPIKIEITSPGHSSPNPEYDSYLFIVSQGDPKEQCRRGTGDSIFPEYAVLPSRVSTKKAKQFQCIYVFVVSCLHPNIRILKTGWISVSNTNDSKILLVTYNGGALLEIKLNYLSGNSIYKKKLKSCYKNKILYVKIATWQ